MERGGKFLDKLFVRVSLSTANMVMEMGHREYHAQCLVQVHQTSEKRHRVCAAGTRDRYPLSRSEQLLFADIFGDVFQH